MKLAKYIDYTNLKPESTTQDIIELCKKAKEKGYRTVCVNACRVSLAKKQLEGSNVGIATVVGFPLGATTTSVKVLEAKEAVLNGATEIDMVINIGALIEGDYDFVEKDIESVVKESNVPVKVILETCKLTKEQIVIATKLCVKAKAAFVKTSTGFSSAGATIEDVKLMKENCGNLEVKAAGGIRDYETAIAMINAGATRIGASKDLV